MATPLSKEQIEAWRKLAALGMNGALREYYTGQCVTEFPIQAAVLLALCNMALESATGDS